MTRLKRLALSLTLLASFGLKAFAQPIITTVAGRSVPINGAPAITQPVVRPVAVISDGNGGFYVAGGDYVSRVTANGVLTVIAGNGTSVSSGDGGSAAAAGLSSPQGLALDRAGNLFIAEAVAHRIRKVSPEGVISTVAGNGTQGFSGDGGAATSAQLNQPSGVAVDAQGSLFIADSNNRRIRKVAPEGNISTVAGNGVSGFGGDGGPATSAMLSGALGIAVDAQGNLFIGDAWNHRVRQITPNGIINTVVDVTKVGWFGSPVGIAFDASGNLLIADSFFHVIWKHSQGSLSQVAGECRLGSNSSYLYSYPCYGGFRGDGGSATAALLNVPSSVAADSTGNLFIADSFNYRIRKVTPNGVIGTAAGNGTERFAGDNGPATAALLYNPADVVVDAAGNLFIADTYNRRVRKVTPQGIISTVGDTLGQPMGIAVDAKGNLWIAEPFVHRIRKISPEGAISPVAGTGRAGFSGDDGPATAAQLNFPSGIDVDVQGNLFIADVANRRVRKITPNGVITTVAGNGAQGFSGDGGPATAAELGNPNDVAVDAHGNLFIADIANRRIRKVTPNGVITTVAGNGTPGFSGDGGPATSAALGVRGVAVDAQGNLFIAGDQRVRKVTPDGVINTVAGNGTPGFSGDGGLATAAALNGPSNIAVDAQGNIFIADTFNHRVRKVAAESPVFFSISDRGGMLLLTPGVPGQIRIGYASIQADAGRPAPSGLAMVGFRQNGVLVSEAGVAASAPIRFGRIYADIQSAVRTGVAMANPNDEAAFVIYYFSDRKGTLRPGSTTIPPRGQIAALLHESPFNGGDSLSGSFTFIASVPIAVAAIRGRTNERGEWLMTTLPVEDLSRPPIEPTVVLPHFAAGGGWTTEIVLVNRTESVARGTVRFRGPSGQNATVRVGSSASDTFPYSVAPGASEVLRAVGTTSNIQSGSVVVLPEPNTTPPTGFAIFSYEDGGVITREVGVPATAPGTAFRLYAEAIGEFGSAGSIQTALAVANTSANAAMVTLELNHLDGSPTGLLGTLQVPSNGQTAVFLNQVPGFKPLPALYKGVLRVSSSTPISVIGLRARHNERGDLLMAAMPPAAEGASSASNLFFPHIVDSGGYTTELILFSANSGPAATGVLRFVSQSGIALSLSVQPTPVNSPAAGNAGAPLEQRGLRLKTDKATPGYVLFTPLASDTSYLVDNDGKVVRTWISELLSNSWVYMKDNGHIVRGGKEINIAGINGGGQGGRFQEFNFDGELVWDFSFNDEKHLPHHDVVILPNGNVLAIVWELKTAEEARKAGRREGFIPQGGVWPDMLIEFEPQYPKGAKIVWEWHSWDHLIQNVNPEMDHYGNLAEHPERINVNGDLIGLTTPPRNPTSDMFHTNSVSYNPELDQILLSIPRFNEVWVIDHSTTTEEAGGSSGGRSGKGGDLLYRWGNPQAYGRGDEADRLLGFQHDARWIPAGRPGAGHITVFSNRTPGPHGEYTKVYELVPPVDGGGQYFTGRDSAFGPAGPVWTYSAESLEAGNVSGAERLANGLTLISSGPQGRIFEVTPAGEIVWEYWSPYAGTLVNSGTQSPNAFILFRAVRIPADHPALAGRRLQALDPQPR